MSKIPFINIHTHSQAGAGEWAIQNIHKDFQKRPLDYFSAGLHPWYITKDNWQEGMQELRRLSDDAHMIAFGECGLDKVAATDYGLQQEVFVAQVLLANQLNRPLIIHCVRAHEDVLQLLELKKSTVPVIFHGFNKGAALAQKIIASGFYLSFGLALERPHMAEIFKQLPISSLFLETDDATISIESVYQRASAIRHLSVDELSLQLKINLQTVFNIAV